MDYSGVAAFVLALVLLQAGLIVTQESRDKEATCSDEKKCQNGAPCTSRGGNKFCDCLNGTTGDFCDVVTECEEKGQYAKCTGEKGNCTYNVTKKQAECVCPPKKKYDKVERYCQDICAENDCQNGGKCEVKEGVKSCNCLQGTSGKTCETVADCSGKLKDCKDDKGRCTFSVEEEKAVCKCDENKAFYEGLGYCEAEKCVDTCGESIHVACKVKDDGFECECKEQSKKHDKRTKKCRSTCTADTPCMYGAKCEGEDEAEAEKFCNCPSGTSGDTCDAIDDCVTGTFKNCTGGDKGTCLYDTKQQKAVCNCTTGGKLKDKSGYCEECNCGEFSEDCSFNKDDKVCKCKEGYQDKNGICEECNCGKETKSCKFENEIKKCTCNEKFALKNGICEECDCGGNSTSCAFVKGVKTCNCKTGNAQNGGKCEECKCKENTKPCKFEDGKKVCECKDKFSLKDEVCTDCACGGNASGCEFRDKEKECFCNKGYAVNNGICDENKCFSKCGVESDEHPDIKCEGDKFGDASAIKCTCHDYDLKFDSNVKKCRATCSDDKKCDNKASCASRGGNKFCDCFKGTTGDFCDVVTECEENGQYAKCTGEKGTCTYNDAKKEAECVCPPKQKYDKVEGYCQDECKTKEDCSEEKICFHNSYCSCEPGKRGELCEIIPGCTEELQKKCEDGGVVCAFNRTADNYASCDCQNEYLVFIEAQKKCIVLDSVCEKEKPSCQNTNGNCSVTAESGLTCVCEEGKEYNESVGCAVNKCKLKCGSGSDLVLCEGDPFGEQDVTCKCKEDKMDFIADKKLCKYGKSLSGGGIAAIIISILAVIVLVSLYVLHRRRKAAAGAGDDYQASFRGETIAFESALYNANYESLESNNSP